MGSPRVGGHASKAERAHRLAVLRELWPTGRSIAIIGERLGVSEGYVSDLARAAGLPQRRISLDKRIVPDILPPMDRTPERTPTVT